MGWQSYVLGYKGEPEVREQIVAMLKAHDLVGMCCPEVLNDEPWRCEPLDMTFRGDVGGEAFRCDNDWDTPLTEVIISKPYKKGILSGCTHAILVGNGGGRWATFCFFQQYQRHHKLHHIRVEPYSNAFMARTSPVHQPPAKRARTEPSAASSAPRARIVGEAVFDRLSLSIAPELLEKP